MWRAEEDPTVVSSERPTMEATLGSDEMCVRWMGRVSFWCSGSTSSRVALNGLRCTVERSSWFDQSGQRLGRSESVGGSAGQWGLGWCRRSLGRFGGEELSGGCLKSGG